MMRIFFILIVAFTLYACSSKKQIVQSEISTREKEHRVFYVDTLFYTPASKARLKISISQLCDSLKQHKNWKSKNRNATAKVKVQNGTLYVSAECDSLALKAQIRRELTKEYESNNKERLDKKQTGFSFFSYYLTAVLTFISGAAVGIILKRFII